MPAPVATGMAKATMTFAIACRDFFGLKPGETTVQFMDELKALTDEDKAEIGQGLVANGYSAAAFQPKAA